MMNFKKNSLFLYCNFFLISYFIITLPISLKNSTLGFSGLFFDGFSQHLVFFEDYIGIIKSWLFNGGEFPTYNFNIGYGGDVISTYSYYGFFDPFNIIAIILPLKWIEFSFYLIIFIKTFLSGLFFCLLLKRYNIKNKKVIAISGVFYALNSCLLSSSMRHPIFTGVFTLLPLAILGVEKAINGESKFLLITSVAMTFFVQFYMSAYTVLAVETYLITRICDKKISLKKRIHSIIKCNLFILIGLSIAGIVLLTQLSSLLNNGRMSGNSFVLYDFTYYGGLIFTFLFPFSSTMYTIGIGNIFAVFLILLFILFNKRERWLKILIIVEFSFLLFSGFGYAFSLFSYVNNRWMFIIMIPLTIALAISLDNFKDYSKDNFLRVIKIILQIITIGIGCLVLGLVDDYIKNIFIKVILIASAFLLFSLLIFVIEKIKLNKITNKINYKKITEKFLCFHIVLLLIFNLGAAIKWNSKAYKFNDYYDNEFSSSKIDDDSFYRVDKSSYVRGYKDVGNDSIYGNYSSTSLYSSMNNGNLIDMLNYFELNNLNLNVRYTGVDNRYVFESLLGVKYYISKDSDLYKKPYNFSHAFTYQSNKYEETGNRYAEFEYLNGEVVKENTNIYLNNNYLSLGYVYDSYLISNELNNMNGIERQDALLNNVILEEEIEDISKGTYKNNSVNNLNFEIKNSKGIKLENKKIIVKDINAHIILRIEKIANSEVYLKLNNLKNLDNKKFKITYESPLIKKDRTINPKGNYMYNGDALHLENMGYYESAEFLEIKISLSEKGIYSFDNLSLYSYKMDEVIGKIEKLQKKQLENVAVSNNNVKGQIYSESKGILFLSIPYSKGFKAFINGKNVKILKANKGFMAIEIDEGDNFLELKYETEMLNKGTIITLFGLCCAVVYLPIEAYIKKKKSKYDEE